MTTIDTAVRKRAPGPMTAAGDHVPRGLLLVGATLLAFLLFPFLSLLSTLPQTQASAGFAGLSRETLDAMRTTIVSATAAVAIDAVLGIPLALWLGRSRSRWRHVVTVLVLLPLALPPVVGGLELVLWLGPHGWLGAWLDRIGLNPLDNLAGSVLAQMLVAAPFVIIAARAGLANVDSGIVDAARSLGCSPLRALVRVMLPAARRTIGAGIVLGWLRGVGEFGTTMIVAYHPQTLSSLTYVNLSGRGIRAALPSGALLGGLGVLAAMALVLADSRRGHRGELRPLPEEEAGSSPATRLDWMHAPKDPEDGGHEMQVEVRGSVGSFTLDVAFSTPATAIAILGPSGAGKSLTLRTMAGLLRPAEGRVVVGGRELLDTAKKLEVAPEDRGLGYVAQHHALFDHLDVEGNLTFGLRSLGHADRDARVAELLRVLGIEGRRHARPRTLSGGERQRVALARALAPAPAALLLDEPFASLDPAVRQGLRVLLRDVHERTGVPLVLVTHDREDALAVADYVVVVDDGRVVQEGPIEEVFARPANRTVARLVGIPNVVAVRDLEPHPSGGVLASTDWGQVRTPTPSAADSALTLHRVPDAEPNAEPEAEPEAEPDIEPGAGPDVEPEMAPAAARSGRGSNGSPNRRDGQGGSGNQEKTAGWELAVPADAVHVTWEGESGVVASVRPSARDWRVIILPSFDKADGDPLEVLVPGNGGVRPTVGSPCTVALDPRRCHLMPVS